MTAAESVLLQAERLREGLQWSKETTASATAVLDTYGKHVGELDHLIQPVALRVQALTVASEKIKAARSWADSTLQYLDTTRQVEATVKAGPRGNLEDFERGMARLEGSIAFFEQHQGMVVAERAGAAAQALRLEGLQQAANDFWALLCEFSTVPSAARLAQQVHAESDPGRPKLSGSDADVDTVPPHVVARLRRLAALMLVAGETSCFRTFVDARRNLLERTIAGLGSDYTSKDDYARLPWPVLEKKMQVWILLLRVVVRCAMAESRLAAGVFEGEYADAAFSEVVSKSLANTVNFGEAIVLGRRAPEKVFGLLDCHENLDAMLPTLHDILSGTRVEARMRAAEKLNQSMQAEARDTFAEFEASIGRDSVRHLVADGTVHPLTAYSLSFLKRLFTYESSITVLFADPEATPGLARTASMRERSMAAAGDPALVRRMSKAIQKVLDLLITNLTSKSKAYKTKPLAAVFMMNNLHYMVKTVESSEALTVLGEEWIEQHKDQVEEYGEHYQRLAWGLALDIMSADANDTARRDKAVVKERYRAISSALAAMEAEQSGWTIPDGVLRANLRDALAEDFLPPYEALLARNAAHSTRVSDKYIKYSVSDVRNMINGALFEGHDGPQARKGGGRA